MIIKLEMFSPSAEARPSLAVRIWRVSDSVLREEDGKTYKVLGNMTYKEWVKQAGISTKNNQAMFTNEKQHDIIKKFVTTKTSYILILVISLSFVKEWLD